MIAFIKQLLAEFKLVKAVILNKPEPASYLLIINQQDEEISKLRSELQIQTAAVKQLARIYVKEKAAFEKALKDTESNKTIVPPEEMSRLLTYVTAYTKLNTSLNLFYEKHNNSLLTRDEVMDELGVLITNNQIRSR